MLLVIDDIIVAMIGGVMDSQLIWHVWLRDSIIFSVHTPYPYIFTHTVHSLRKQFEFRM